MNYNKLPHYKNIKNKILENMIFLREHFIEATLNFYNQLGLPIQGCTNIQKTEASDEK
ncbi:MAG: hypothetical protein R3299_03470 [Arenibacter sp.]|nr:hypothetical protein [Arenibacter sp.]